MATPHRKRARFSAKDDAYFCRTRQEENHRVKMAQMKEIHDLQVKELKLKIGYLHNKNKALAKVHTVLDDLQ